MTRPGGIESTTSSTLLAKSSTGGGPAASGVDVPAQGRDGGYWSVSGTSPACALVAGVAALIKSRYPNLPPDLVASAMTSTATHQPAGRYDSQVGFGIVDAAAALTKAGRLAGDRPAVNSVKAAARYHGAVPPEPVGPRGSGQLILFALLALSSLVLIATAATRLAVLRRSPDRSSGPSPGWSPDRADQ